MPKLTQAQRDVLTPDELSIIEAMPVSLDGNNMLEFAISLADSRIKSEALEKSPMSRTIIEWLKNQVVGAFLYDEDGDEVNLFELPDWLYREMQNAQGILDNYLEKGVIPFENEQIEKSEARRKMLKKYEWVALPSIGNRVGQYCLECGKHKDQGQADDCALNALAKEG